MNFSFDFSHFHFVLWFFFCLFCQYSSSLIMPLLKDGIVYDVTKFLEEHPGGEAILMMNAGQ